MCRVDRKGRETLGTWHDEEYLPGAAVNLDLETVAEKQANDILAGR